MDYFRRLGALLKLEKDEDRLSWQSILKNLSISQRRENGFTWFPVAIKGAEPGRGDYLTIEIERTSNFEFQHQFRFGMTVAIFSNHDAQHDRLEGLLSHISGNTMKISLRVDELPDWTRKGKLGIDAVFDENSYEEMERAMKVAEEMLDQKQEGKLVRILCGQASPTISSHTSIHITELNEKQNTAVNKILSGSDLAIVHGPPGTGKTTTLVQAIAHLVKAGEKRILVVAPSNAAVDLLSEKINDAGMMVLRVGNPARVSEKQLNLTLDHRVSRHHTNKEIRRLRKQAAEYRDLAQKYKRSFGAAEREQRKALFAEARSIMKEVERMEQYIIEDLISGADVITATLVGASHYTVRHLEYSTVIIDEAAQALEPSCWIPVIKGKKLVMAGDHCQLPPTIKSMEAAKGGLEITLMEKLVALYPETVVRLEEQYRMHEKIMRFSSIEFYDDQLKAHASVAQRKLFDDDQPLLFIDTAGCGFEEKREGNSTSNPEEAKFLLDHLAGFLEQLSDDSIAVPSIAVISPYRHQVEIMKERVMDQPSLRKFTEMISVNTIDSFQGQERDVVYISLTRSNAESSIGFLSEVRRMNVAMTRARKKLVVIGDSGTISQFPFYADFISYAEKQNAYVSAWEFIT